MNRERAAMPSLGNREGWTLRVETLSSIAHDLCGRIRADDYPRDPTEFPVRFAAEPALGTFTPVPLASWGSASPSLEE
jgi:hypothetical protein